MKRLNLLPKPKQEELARERIFYGLKVASLMTVLIVIMGVAAQLGVNIYLNRTLARVTSEMEVLKATADKTENAEVKRSIAAVNMTLEDFGKLMDATPQWSKVITAFVKQIPPTVKITSFSGDRATNEITIVGFSPTRDAVIELYNNINADKTNFKDINYPLENVAQPSDVQFTFTFHIADSALTGKTK